MITSRTISAGAEPLLNIETPVLDLGFVQPIDYMGTDSMGVVCRWRMR